MPTSTYSRWERGAQGPESTIPLSAAWAIADKLGTTIDVIVGREAKPEPEGRDLNAFYCRLSEGGQCLLDEITQYPDFREGRHTFRQAVKRHPRPPYPQQPAVLDKALVA